MKILSYLYDADGSDRKVDFEQTPIENLCDRQLLWVNILERDEELIKRVASILNLKDAPVKGILRTRERPKIFKFPDFYHFYIVSVEMDKAETIRPIPIDFLCGKNFVVTVHDGDVNYLQEFTNRKTGETHIGGLDTESFVATMLDLHISSYFRVLEKIEKKVDEMDVKILKRDLNDDEFIEQMVSLRGDVSRLRRWFLPHRDVFYALSRPDFRGIADSDSPEDFQTLNRHFDSALDSIENSRDAVLSLFDLYTTKTSHRMNNLMKRLTFITLIVGTMGVVAGVLGMNFDEAFFKSANAFWFVIAGMIAMTVGITFFAWKKRWF